MKKTILTIIALLFFGSVWAQGNLNTDPFVLKLKSYLSKSIHFPASAIEKHVQGTVVVSFKVDDNKHVTDVHVVKSLNSDCDAEVLRAVKSYGEVLSLSAETYNAGISFVIQDGKSGPKIMTINQGPYKNFLFDINVIAHASN